MFSNLINTKDNLDKELYSLEISSYHELTYDKNNPIEYFNEMENLIINEFNNLSETKEHNLKSIVHILQYYKEDFSSYYKTCRELSKVMEVPKEVLTMFSYMEYDDFKNLTSIVITNLKLLNSIKSNLSTSKNNSILEAINGISNMKKFKNLSIDINGETIDLDEIIITKKGIFILKIFDFSLDDSIFIEITNDGKLFKHQGMHKKLITKNFKSHLSNYCKFLEKSINEKIKTSEELSNHIKVYPLGVIINNNCKILNVSNIPLLKVNSLENYLSNYNDVLKETDLSLIYDIVSSFITLKENKDFVSVDINTLEYLKIILVSSRVLKEANEEINKILRDFHLKKKEDERRKELSKLRREKLSKYKYIYVGFLVLGSLFIAYKSVSSIMLYSTIRDFNKSFSSSVELKDINSLTDILYNKDLTHSQKSAFISLLNNDVGLKNEIATTVSESKGKDPIKVRENIYITEDKKLKLMPIKITRTSEGPIYLNEDRYTASYFEAFPGIYTVYSEKSGEKVKEKEISILDETSLNLNQE